jgi:hypothetical protein
MKNRRKLFCNFIRDYLVLTHTFDTINIFLIKNQFKGPTGNDKSSKRVGYKIVLKARIPTKRKYIIKTLHKNLTKYINGIINNK